MTTNHALLEIGLEEMPSRFIDDAKQQLKERTIDWLNSLRIPFEDIESYGTPRRLAVLVKDVAEKQPDIEEEVKGPSKKIAVDDDGNWTKAAIGFTKGQGKSVDDLYLKEIKGLEYLFVNKYIAGKKTAELLSGWKEIVLGLQFPKNMRWGDLNVRYIRPIRWVTALYGNEVIPLEIAGIVASDQTYGHRFLGKRISLKNPLAYKDALLQQFVVVDSSEREHMIVDGIKELEHNKGWTIPIDQNLLNEVTNLVEYPTVFSGGFSEEFLSVPEEALVTSMKEHQRYFPVRSKKGELLPYFVGIRNGNKEHLDVVAKGNEKVLRARLSDAQFFYQEDQKQSIEKNMEKLNRVVFQEELGTVHDKMKRVVRLTEQLAQHLNVKEETKENARRAAAISKFDLVTNMVNEFTDLQGIMGEKYALLFGENVTTAKAINEHYMPRNAHDSLPETTEGAIVSIADKLDTIIGCLSIGIVPTGSQDPHGLRRQAIGILQILKQQKWNISVEALVEASLSIYQQLGIANREKQEIRKDSYEFFYMRAVYIMREDGIDPDVAKAVLYNGIGHFAFALEKAYVLMDKRQDKTFKSTQEALVRVLNITSEVLDREVDPELFENTFEKNLFQSFTNLLEPYEAALSSFHATRALEALAMMEEPIHQFFDHTMVMADDHKVKENRLSLLSCIAKRIYQFADLTKIEWKQQF
ncbi:glycine--tRNA ligase subunit beta [Aquibacillus sp. 3ASR75-11]|uniref:Glycine--tRNA ligase beta subunit n=1 Tax=Terrihalobacillus insolitus TaxID=2950438 RepID=A0A9X4AM12_9BACI|nr:glycine--tRNA ligase subunit beta [Terrihalobacillus insolitus]MDC3413359.1 glycine--tRNA ligase subunit beta [Terrihalobacillus insolitus]MDC3424942.1 glycine--tRNA ligase subunit beta [Terrihalobacillus insolitus]